MTDARAWEMRVFLRVAARGAFSAAGRELGITPSATAKLITRIEARLGVRLVERSTRRLRLTPEGEVYRERAEALLAELEAMEAELAGQAVVPSGLVRINSSIPFGRHCLLPLLPDFTMRYPQIRLDLTFTDEVVDLYLARVDIAFRVGKLGDSGLRAVHLGEVRRRIVASPDDLVDHDCLGFNFRRAAAVWPMTVDGRRVAREVEGRIQVSDGETMRYMARAGLGLARLAEYHVRDDIAAGRLVTVLDDCLADSEVVHAVYLGRERAPRRIEAFLDHAAPRLRERLRQG